MSTHTFGPAYLPLFDQKRLTKQFLRIFELMSDGKWRTLDEIARYTGDPHASVSAQLRHFRKEQFGQHKVDKRRRGDPTQGLFEYKLTVNRGQHGNSTYPD